MAQNQFKILTDEHIAGGVVQQLRKNGVMVERVEDTVGKGTPDPDVLEYANQHGYTLLTHDESIVAHITNRLNSGSNHCGVFIAPNQFRGSKGIGRIVDYVTEWHELIIGGAASLQNDVYNQVNYVK
jgi:hypothetical protein